MDAESMRYLGAGIAAIGLIGASIGVGNIFVAFLNGIARNPSVEGKLSRSAFIGAGLVEALGVFAFAVSLLLLFLK